MLSISPNKFKSYAEYILQLYTDRGNNEDSNSERISCYKFPPPKQKLPAHYRTKKDCDIIYTICNLTPEPCPNENCNIWWGNVHELKKHILYHCHLSVNKRGYYKIILTAISIEKTLENADSLTLP